MCCFSSCASPQGFSLMRLDPGCWERIRYKENCWSTSDSQCATTAKYKGAKQRCLHLHTNERRDRTCREKLCLLEFVTSDDCWFGCNAKFRNSIPIVFIKQKTQFIIVSIRSLVHAGQSRQTRLSRIKQLWGCCCDCPCQAWWFLCLLNTHPLLRFPCTAQPPSIHL